MFCSQVTRTWITYSAVSSLTERGSLSEPGRQDCCHNHLFGYWLGRWTILAGAVEFGAAAGLSLATFVGGLTPIFAMAIGMSAALSFVLKKPLIAGLLVACFFPLSLAIQNSANCVYRLCPGEANASISTAQN